MADPAMAVPAMAVPAMAVPASADLAMAVPASAGLATAVAATVVAATVVAATVVAATVVAATAVAATATGMETVEHRSAEREFFAPTTAPSDHPVSVDTELRSEPFDLERREQRRARFTRVVGGIVATLSIGSLLALTRPAPSAAEAAPISAGRPRAIDVAPSHLAQPTPAASPDLSVSRAPVEAPPPAAAAAAPEAAEVPEAAPVLVSTPPAAPVTRALATPAVRALARKSSPAAVEPRLHVRALQAPAAASFVPAQTDDRPPPTARFPD
jgi:hypothetical protein